MPRIMGRDGEYTWTSCMFFKAVVPAVFLFGLEMCVMTHPPLSVHGMISKYGHTPIHFPQTPAEVIHSMVLPDPWGVIGGSGSGAGGGLCNMAAENRRAVHSDMVPIQNMCRDIEDSGIIQNDAVVETS